MRKLGLVGIFSLLFGFVFSQYSRDIDYIRTHAKLAVEEMELYKIPASITLSQGILETGGGQSRLAEIANNHFGIKCKAEWKGPSISHTDDAPNECFRKYENVQESYRDHSKFLAERPYYKELFKLKMDDYKAWAHGLKKAGYATNPKYAGILIGIIERNNLAIFDDLSSKEVDKKLNELYGHSNIIALSNYPTSKPESQNSTTIAKIDQPKKEKEVNPEIENHLKKVIKAEIKSNNPMLRIKFHPNGMSYVIANENESLKTISKLYDSDLRNLARFNELPENAKLTPGQLVFFSKKKTKGVQNTYQVQQGDNMYLIAQKCGIRIDRLYRLNKMKAGQQPKVGTTLNLITRKR